MYIHNSEVAKRKNASDCDLLKNDAAKWAERGAEHNVSHGRKTQFIHAGQALLQTGWADDVRLGIVDGKIASVETGVSAQPGDEHHAVIVSGMPNLHSHAFQYGMAGLAERRGPSADSF